MSPRALAAVLVLAAVAVTVLLLAGLDLGGAPPGGDGAAGDGSARLATTGPGLRGQGQAAEDDPASLGPPTGPLPAVLEDDPERVGPGLARLRGTVRLRGSRTVARGGRVELLLVKEEHWPGSWDAPQRLVDARELLEGFEHHAPIHGDGTWQADVPRGVRVARTVVRAEPLEPRSLLNFVDTAAPAALHVTEERMTLDLEADPGVQVRGRAVEDRSGAPVLGVEVVLAMPGALPARGVSAADGSFVVSGLRPDDVEGHPPLEFRVRHPTFAQQVVWAAFDEAFGAYAPLDVRLAPGVLVGGVVRVTGAERPGEVLLILVQPGGAGPLGAGERELARTTSLPDGRFAFPPFAPASGVTLRVPSRIAAGRAGAGGCEQRDLDLGTDRTDLVVELAGTWSAPLRLRLPDGRIVGWRRGRALVEDAAGAWCAVDGGGRDRDVVPSLAVVPGHAHRIVAFAEVPEGRALRLYRGQAVVRCDSEEEAARGLVVDLLPGEAASVPPAEARTPRVRIDAHLERALHVWRLQVQDAATGAPLAGRRLHVHVDRGTTRCLANLTLREDGRLRLELGLGLAHVRLWADGYDPQELRLEPREPGYDEAVISLQARRER